MENKNTVIALILMLIVWTGFTYFFPPKQQLNNSEKAVNVVSKSADIQKIENTPVVLTPVLENVEEFTQLTEEKNIVVENDKFIATFSNLDAAIISFKLKDYREENEIDSPVVSLINEKDNISTVVVNGEGSLNLSEKLIYNIDSPSNVKIDGDKSITFKAALPNGLLITKTYTFTKEDYVFNCTIFLQNNSVNQFTGKMSLGLKTFWTDEMAGNRFDFIGPASLVVDEVSEDSVDDIKEKPIEYNDGVRWSGFEKKYFVSIVVPVDSNAIDKLSITYRDNVVSNAFYTKKISISPNNVYRSDFQLYFGPKDLDQLKLAGNDLAKLVDFGFFELLAKPLHLLLKFFYGFIGNYGVSIILLTVILKMIFWPLTQKSYMSMRAMQTLQPEMKKIREKYSGDKESLNKKMMELYKEHRVNPMGGCLPMLVQIPVFFALYKVLLGTIELRHSPFMFWITDLSVKDPYYITPVIMGITMFVQQKLTPSTMDPTQAKLMMAMPLVFTFMFLNFPAGLVIYWLVNNLLTIFQQYLIYRKSA